MRAALVGLLVAAAGAPAATRPRAPVVTLERTACFGDCPVYKVALYDDGAVTWHGAANVGRKGAARGRVDPARVAQLVDAFVTARFFDMDSDGTIPAPVPKGGARQLSIPCTDTSHAITTFRHGGGSARWTIRTAPAPPR
jgi:hypothetical protein